MRSFARRRRLAIKLVGWQNSEGGASERDSLKVVHEPLGNLAATRVIFMIPGNTHTSNTLIDPELAGVFNDQAAN